MERLSGEMEVDLPRGATHVLPAAREIYQKGGEELLRRAAKMHFKTTKQVVD
jgi:ribonuclease HIII